MVAIVLMVAFLLFTGEYIYLTAQGKPAPDEIKSWLFSTLAALVAWLVQNKEETPHE
jgi:hypothetical protein